MPKDFSKRLESLIFELNVSTRQFELECKISNGTIAKAIKTHTSLSQKTIQKIHIRYRDVNMDWLLYGTGEMYKPKGYKQSDSSQSTANEDTAEYKISDLIVENKSLKKRILEVEQKLKEAWIEIGRTLASKDTETGKKK